ncbi:MAG: diaminopimelate epimerase [Firmicutes bacterium]|nr:diaminopimelate epimerase [Bacillota bacterium]
MQLDFIKMHGLGNDFIVVCTLEAGGHGVAGSTAGDTSPDKPEDIWDHGSLRNLETMATESLEAFSRGVCDRHFGVGADGLVLILPSTKADFRMRIFNSDGSEARMCGNAIRCVAKYVYERGIFTKSSLKVETLGGIVEPTVVTDGENRVSGVTVDMGQPVFATKDIPCEVGCDEAIMLKRTFGQASNPIEFTITCVSMGNPHCVIFVDDVDKVDLESVGPLIENDSIFPQRVNVEFAHVEGPESIRMRVWERGAGATLACGTGACATLAAAARVGLSGRYAKLHLPGGVLDIRWAQDNHIYMTGPAEEVFAGRLSPDWLEARLPG